MAHQGCTLGVRPNIMITLYSLFGGFEGEQWVRERRRHVQPASLTLSQRFSSSFTAMCVCVVCSIETAWGRRKLGRLFNPNLQLPSIHLDIHSDTRRCCSSTCLYLFLLTLLYARLFYFLSLSSKEEKREFLFRSRKELVRWISSWVYWKEIPQKQKQSITSSSPSLHSLPLYFLRGLHSHLDLLPTTTTAAAKNACVWFGCCRISFVMRNRNEKIKVSL